jgi:VanZ family protein
MKRWLPTIAFFLFVSLVIFLADAGLAPGFFGWVQSTGSGDKVGHFILIGGLAFCLNLSLGCRKWCGLLAGSVIVVVLCTAEEFSQLLLAGRRNFDWLDLAADYAGILAAGLAAQRLARPRPEV